MSSVNPGSPYAPPTAPLEAQRGAPEREELASMGQRFADSLIDGLVVGFVSLPIGFLAGSLGGAAAFTLSVVVQLGYYFVLEHTMGATAGKLVTGVRVVSEDGTRASAGQIVGRTLARLIPFEVFSFLFSRHPVGWHDSLSGTRVIRAR